jgi:hypothetical protein
MTTIAQKITQFKASLQAGSYEIDGGFEEFIMKCVTESKLDQPEVTQAGAVAPAQQTKQLNCYNIFMKEKMAQLEEEKCPGKDKVGKVAEAWGLMSEAEKDVYKAKAKASEPVIAHVKANPKKKGPKGLTGWQLYVSKQMQEVKKNKEVLPNQRLGKIGEMWKALTKVEQEAYVAEAKAMPPKEIKA